MPASSPLKFPPSPSLENGQIGDMTIPLLLVGLRAQGATGVLTIERPGQIKTIYISRGLPVGVASNQRHEQLGAFLLEEGKISLADFRAATELIQEKQMKQGEAFILLGKLTSAEVYQALERQARFRILDVFGWDTGHYAFSTNDSFWNDITAVDLPFLEVLAEGMRRTYGFTRLARLFDGLEKTYFSLEERFVGEGGWTGLQDRELRLLPSINGTRTLVDLAALPGVDLRLLFPLLAYLALGGWLKGAPAPAETFVMDGTPAAAASSTSPKDMEMRNVILENYIRVKAYNYYRLLGVTPAATPEQIQQAYEKLSQKYDPARYTQYDLGPMRARLFEIYAKIETASQTLRDTNRRASYDLFLKRNEEAFESDRRQRFSAEIEFTLGREHLEKGRLPTALQHLSRAADLNPRQPDYLSGLASAYMKSEPPQVVEAKTRLAAALELDPHHFRSIVELGKVYQYEGRTEMARKMYESADRIRPETPEVTGLLRQVSAKSA
ncbi:MAG: DnaJ domain-containing protein [Deltaproteobacteria bacterium]|nr:DnaJ domain-containing protein [Deltaproteobacteria bacterium]